jgi:hypothetical protein
MSIAADYTERSGVIAGYVHDDWRVGTNLTVNLGLRYEYEQPLREDRDRMISGFDAGAALPITAAAEAAYAASPMPEIPAADFHVRGGVLYPDTGGPPAAWRSDGNNLMPRAGFSWQPLVKTAVRGGYGLYYDTLGPNRITVNQTGYSRVTPVVPSLDNGQTFIATLANPFPDGLLAPEGSGLGLMTNAGLDVSFPYVGEVRTPRTHRWSIGVQQELPWLLLAEVTYVAGYSQNLTVARELNAVPGQYFSTSDVRDNATNNYLTQQVRNPLAGLLPGTGLNAATVSRSQLLRPYPQFTSVTALETTGTSDYKSVQARLERRMAGGITLQVGYTWSRTMTEAEYLNQFDSELHRVIGPFDRTHMFVTSGIVELPFGRGRHWGTDWNAFTETVLGGWQVSYLLKQQSGAPLAFGNYLLEPGLTIDDIPLPRGDRTIARWFNVDAFERAPAQQLVSNVRTTPARLEEVRGPGYVVLDLGIMKNVELGERMRLQLRVEAYNALNTTNWNNPNTTPTNTAFGTITSQNPFPRQFQLAARFSF